MQRTSDKQNVILLHGLSRTKFAMAKLANELKDHYNVINQGYPSRQHSIEHLSKLAIESALKKCTDQPIHFVTHSLGGILVRQYLSEHKLQQLGRVVMLGPPNKGSELVDKFRSRPFLTRLFDAANGPAGKQLSTDKNSKPNSLGSVDFELGVIAGNRSYNLLFNYLLPSEADGKVTVASSKVSGMIDHITLPVDHTFMMRDKDVIKQIRWFLENGAFQKHDEHL